MTTTNNTAQNIHITINHYHSAPAEQVQKPVQKATGLLAFVTAGLAFARQFLLGG